jgi:hypothetical protein
MRGIQIRGFIGSVGPGMSAYCDDVLQYEHIRATDKLSGGTAIGAVTTGMAVLRTNTLLSVPPFFHFPRRLISVACHAVQNTQPLRYS